MTKPSLPDGTWWEPNNEAAVVHTNMNPAKRFAPRLSPRPSRMLLQATAAATNGSRTLKKLINATLSEGPVTFQGSWRSNATTRPCHEATSTRMASRPSVTFQAERASNAEGGTHEGSTAVIRAGSNPALASSFWKSAT